MPAGLCEFPTDYIKTSPEILCGTYHPTFLYEMLWRRTRRRLDRRRGRIGGRLTGYTLGRIWIEMLRIDPANHFLGLRINVFTAGVVFLGAVTFLILKRTPRDDPVLVLVLVRGPDKGDKKPAEPCER